MRLRNEVIILKNAKGEVLVETPVISKADRTSMYTSASLRQLDALIKHYPTAVSGFIGTPPSRGTSLSNALFVITKARRGQCVEVLPKTFEEPVIPAAVSVEEGPTLEMIKEMARRYPNARLSNLKKALVACTGDLDRAGIWLREKGWAQ